MVSEYTNQGRGLGIETENRGLLERLHRALPAPFRAAEAAGVLEMGLARTRRLLSYLADRGWLARIRPGLYATVPLGASSPSSWKVDPWIVAARVFAPCYIGGWSACEYWDLTEQLFRDVFVVTGRRVGKRKVEMQGTVFRVKVVSRFKLFGTKPVWREHSRIQVSDGSRTVLDLLDDPAVGGGIRHVALVLKEYFGSEEHRDEERLLEYAARLENRTVYKRLGYLLEQLDIGSSSLIETCKKRMSSGLSALDSSVKRKGRVLKRWNLRVNVTLSGIDPHS